MLPVFYCSTRRLLSSRVISSHCGVFNVKYSSDKSSPAKSSLPTQHQIQLVYDVLAQDIPKYLTRSFDPSIYANDMIFEDNIRNVRTIVDILKMTQHAEEGTIKVRWTVRGLSNFAFIRNLFSLNIIKYLFSSTEPIDSKKAGITEYDGFSIFYINGDGLVQKHLADKMIPANEGLEEKLVPKLAKKVTNVAV